MPLRLTFVFYFDHEKNPEVPPKPADILAAVF